jgi:hypothetical protein
MEYIAIAACFTAALGCFVWLLTRNDQSSAFWARARRRSEPIGPNKSASIPRSVMQYFPAIFLICAMIPSVAAGQRQWTPDDMDFRRPFGDISIGAANRTQRDFQIFFNSLSAQERAEIRARCAVIGSDQRFTEWARDVCGNVEQMQDSTEKRSSPNHQFGQRKGRLWNA